MASKLFSKKKKQSVDEPLEMICIFSYSQRSQIHFVPCEAPRINGCLATCPHIRKTPRNRNLTEWNLVI